MKDAVKMLQLEGRVEKFLVKEDPFSAGGLEFNVLSKNLLLPSYFQEQVSDIMGQFTQKWGELERPSGFLTEWGVPTLIVRIDFTLITGITEEVFVYDIEPAPRLLGLACEKVDSFNRKLARLAWPTKLRVLKNQLQQTDDFLWIGFLQRLTSAEVKEDSSYIAPRISELDSDSIKRSIWPPKVTKRFGLGWLWEIFDYYSVMRADEFLVRGAKGNERKQKIQKIITSNFRKFIQKYFLEGKNGVVIKSAHPEEIPVIIDFSRLESDYLSDYYERELPDYLSYCLRTLQEWRANTFRYFQEYQPPVPLELDRRPAEGVYQIFVGYHIAQQGWESLGGFLRCKWCEGGSGSILVPVVIP